MQNCLTVAVKSKSTHYPMYTIHNQDAAPTTSSTPSYLSEINLGAHRNRKCAYFAR